MKKAENEEMIKVCGGIPAIGLEWNGLPYSELKNKAIECENTINAVIDYGSVLKFYTRGNAGEGTGVCIKKSDGTFVSFFDMVATGQTTKGKRLRFSDGKEYGSPKNSKTARKSQVKQWEDGDDFGMYISDLAIKKGYDPKATKLYPATKKKKKTEQDEQTWRRK